MRVGYLKRGIIAAAAFAALAAALAGAADTGAISGFVMDEDGQLLGGALVVVKAANRFATTNANGYYVVTPVPVGTFEVTASRVGCGEQVKSGVKVIAGLRTNLSFRLRSGATGEEEGIASQVVDKFADTLVRPSGDYCPAAWDLDRHIRNGGVADAGMISGFVKDEDGRPLSGALVVVTGADLSATTDDDGYYYIRKVPMGTFDVKASRVGCDEQVESGVKVAGLRINLSFQLRSDAAGEEEEIESQVVDEFADRLALPPGQPHYK